MNIVISIFGSVVVDKNEQTQIAIYQSKRPFPYRV